MKNKRKLAAFSEAPFIKEQKLTYQKGILFSLNEKLSTNYKLKNYEHLPIIYDDYFIIFGNREFRIRTLDNKIYSYFGRHDNYYDNKGESSPEVFFGDDSNEMEMNQY